MVPFQPPYFLVEFGPRTGILRDALYIVKIKLIAWMLQEGKKYRGVIVVQCKER